MLPGALRRLRHVRHLQVLNAHERVVFADRGRGLMEVVMPDASDPGVQTLNTAFSLGPVVAELDLAAQRLLCFP